MPILDGFVLSAGRPLQAYQRPYYECAVRVTRADVGSLVRVTARITAWNSSASRYEVLQSNGRIESDLLDRLEQSLGGKVAAKPLPVQAAPATSQTSSATKSSATPEISAPTPHFPSVSRLTPTPSDASPVDPALDQEAKGLEDLLRNQAHPTNLIAVKQDRTPILQDASSDAKVLFLASAEDEFEILDINPEWVHVRISGLSRGWLRRSSVELLDGSQVPAKSSSARSGAEAANTAQPPNRLFSVTGEEDGNFPGDWAPLKGKNVKIISIQQEPGTGRITSPQDKMGFAENLFRSQGAKTSAGLVLIFDAEDGGMVAATSAVIDLWRTGALSEQAFWKQCYLDPPEILGSNN
ncbi:MAG TPA: hypothetical protein VJO35_09175 [Terriglobales bacterium]|nr:hypothetical protein [Terriglobales bacterium]